jgi:zinc protease
VKKIDLDIGERVLGNGLTCIAVRNPSVPTFAAAANFRATQLEEGPREGGLAYLTGSMLEEGTRSLDSVSLAEAVEVLGAALDTSAGSASIQCPVDEARKAVRLLHQVVTDPAFDAREVRRLEGEIAAEIEADAAEPRTLASQRFRREIYGDHPLGRPRYGSAESTMALRPADLRRFHARYYGPHDAIVAAAGPWEVEATLDLLAKTFRSLRGDEPARSMLSQPAPLAVTRAVHLPLEREQVHVFLGHLGIRRSDPDYVALLVMDHILGTGPGFTSRIGKKLRDEQGLCYTVHAAITNGAGLEPGLFSAYIGTSPEHRTRAIDGFLREIRMIRDEPVTEQELRDVADYLTGSWVFGLERNANLVGYAIRCKRYALGYDYIQRYPDMVRAITREEVQRVARRHLDPERVAIVSAGAS